MRQVIGAGLALIPALYVAWRTVVVGREDDYSPGAVFLVALLLGGFTWGALLLLLWWVSGMVGG